MSNTISTVDVHLFKVIQTYSQSAAQLSFWRLNVSGVCNEDA